MKEKEREKQDHQNRNFIESPGRIQNELGGTNVPIKTTPTAEQVESF